MLFKIEDYQLLNGTNLPFSFVHFSDTIITRITQVSLYLRKREGKKKRNRISYSLFFPSNRTKSVRSHISREIWRQNVSSPPSPQLLSEIAKTGEKPHWSNGETHLPPLPSPLSLRPIMSRKRKKDSKDSTRSFLRTVNGSAFLEKVHFDAAGTRKGNFWKLSPFSLSSDR